MFYWHIVLLVKNMGVRTKNEHYIFWQNRRKMPPTFTNNHSKFVEREQWVQERFLCGLGHFKLKFFLQFLQSFQQHIQRKIPNLWLKKLILYQNNVLSHTVLSINRFLAKKQKPSVFEHQLYLPGLAPCASFVFLKTKIILEMVSVLASIFSIN